MKKDEPCITFRTTVEEKERFQEIAKSVGLDVSKLIRSTVLSGEKLILLPGGDEIAKGICQLMKEFSHAYKGGYIASDYAPKLLVKIDELVSSVNKLIDRTTDICSDGEKSQKEGIL